MAVVGIGETDVHSEFRMNKCGISWHFSSIEYQSRNFSQVTKINKELLFYLILVIKLNCPYGIFPPIMEILMNRSHLSHSTW